MQQVQVLIYPPQTKFVCVCVCVCVCVGGGDIWITLSVRPFVCPSVHYIW